MRLYATSCGSLEFDRSMLCPDAEPGTNLAMPVSSSLTVTFFFSSSRRHTRFSRDWSSDVCSSDLVALIGKTEGNGGANDFTRGYATSSYQTLLAPHLGISPDEVGRKIAFVWSGGTEGVLSPHATVFTRSAAQGKPNGARLAMAIEVTRDILPEEVGTMAQVREVAAATRRALAATGITDPKDVHYVQVKGPLLTPASIADADKRGRT